MTAVAVHKREPATDGASAARPYEGLDQLMIDGAWRPGRSGKVNRDRNPYTGEVLIEIPQGDRGDLEAAYASAARAQRGWAAAMPGQRAEVMRKAAVIMEARREEIIAWLIREAGSTRLKASLEWDSVHAVMLQAASLAYMVEGRILPTDIPGMESHVHRKPVGVVGVVSPWNWPLQLSARSVAPALAVGNGVVLLQIANDTEYGLSSAVFTRNLDRGEQFALKIEAGMAHVNDQPVNDVPFNPFGGEKNSGIGRFNGRWAVDAFTTDQWVTIQRQPRQYPVDARAISGPWGGG